MRVKHNVMMPFSVFIALLGALTAAVGAVYHGIKAVIKSILAVAGLFKGVKRAHKRIDALETQVKELSGVMAPQVSAIYQHLLGKD